MQLLLCNSKKRLSHTEDVAKKDAFESLSRSSPICCPNCPAVFLDLFRLSWVIHWIRGWLSLDLPLDTAFCQDVSDLCLGPVLVQPSQHGKGNSFWFRVSPEPWQDLEHSKAIKAKLPLPSLGAGAIRRQLELRGDVWSCAKA